MLETIPLSPDKPHLIFAKSEARIRRFAVDADSQPPWRVYMGLMSAGFITPRKVHWNLALETGEPHSLARIACLANLRVAR